MVSRKTNTETSRNLGESAVGTGFSGTKVEGSIASGAPRFGRLSHKRTGILNPQSPGPVDLGLCGPGNFWCHAPTRSPGFGSYPPEDVHPLFLYPRETALSPFANRIPLRARRLRLVGAEDPHRIRQFVGGADHYVPNPHPVPRGMKTPYSPKRLFSPSVCRWLESKITGGWFWIFWGWGKFSSTSNLLIALQRLGHWHWQYTCSHDPNPSSGADKLYHVLDFWIPLST